MTLLFILYKNGTLRALYKFCEDDIYTSYTFIWPSFEGVSICQPYKHMAILMTESFSIYMFVSLLFFLQRHLESDGSPPGSLSSPKELFPVA